MNFPCTRTAGEITPPPSVIIPPAAAVRWMWRRLVDAAVKLRLAASSACGRAPAGGVGGSGSGGGGVTPVVTDLQLQQIYRLANTTSASFSSSCSGPGSDTDPIPALRDFPGFKTRVFTSSIPGGGEGVYLEGSVNKGDVVALYPGIFYPPMPLWTIPAIDGWKTTSLLLRHEGNAYLMHLSGLGGYIDAQPAVVAACRQGREESWSPFSCGHIINHPPPGGYANVSTVSFRWIDVYKSQPHSLTNSTALLEFFRSVVPLRFGEGPWFVDHQESQGKTNSVVHIEDLYQNDNVTSLLALGGVAFVADVDMIARRNPQSGKLENSMELFLDYKLEKKYQPDWYVVPSCAHDREVKQSNLSRS